MSAWSARGGASVLVAALALSVADSATAALTRYTNEEFGFSVVIPTGASTCRSTPPEHDHGINAFLDSGPDGCDNLETRPYLGAAAFYNASEDTSPKAALGGICTLQGATRASAPAGLDIAGLRSAACRANSADKAWIDILVVTQTGPKGEMSAVNYDANLHTTPQRFEADLARFRSFLKGIEIPGSEESATSYAENVSMIRLLASPERFQSHRIATIGFARRAFEESALYLSSEAGLNAMKLDCVWLQYSDTDVDVDFAKQVEDSTGTQGGMYIIVEGTFDTHVRGAAGRSCPAGLRDIRRIAPWPPSLPAAQPESHE